MINYDVQSEATLSALPARTTSAYAILGLTALAITGAVAGTLVYFHSEIVTAWRAVPALLTAPRFWQAAVVGLIAQIVDGALGMAYGLTSTGFLLSIGVPPAAASASVHLAEVFTTGFSGLSHWKLGNVNVGLFRRLVIPGVVGGVIGSYILTSVDGKLLAPWISGYLLLMGVYILFNVFRRIAIATEPPTYVAPLAALGGFIDAVGGGGWGPVVTSTLLGSGQEPRKTIGSVNAAEFFIAVATGFSLAVMGGLTVWTTIAGLIFGGMFAAPVAALLTRYAPARLLMAFVGVLIIVLGLNSLSAVSAIRLWIAGQ